MRFSTGQPTAGPGPSGAHAGVLDWYSHNARDLPWRRRGTTAWGVLCSELMLQQTPVARVLPVWEQWMRRWPEAADLAAAPPGAAVRAWGRLGYPRRALRLHESATIIVARHGGRVPDDPARLRTLPGVGAYTAAAVAAFAYGRRALVLDTNVRRVLTRMLGGAARPRPTSPTRPERAAAEALLPEDPATAARWSVALMELGALVCTARSPRCGSCPLAGRCAWLALDCPTADGPARTQTYVGTDRQCRGRLLAVLREATGPVPAAQLDLAWDDPVQRTRALAGLVADGLVEPLDGGAALALPGTAPPPDHRATGGGSRVAQRGEPS